MSARLLMLGALALGPLDKCAAIKSAAVGGDRDGTPATTATAAPTFEEAALTEARQLCLKGDCLTAHERLQVALPAGSPARQSAVFRDVESRWAASVVGGALNNPDPLARRRQLDEVMRSPVVDGATRERARALVAALPTQMPDSGVAPPPPTSDEGYNIDLARRAVQAGKPKDAREMLLTRLRSNRSTREDRALLHEVCESLKDVTCLAELKPYERH